MRYVVLIACDPGVWERASAEERQGYFDAHDAFERAVAARGTKVSGAALASDDTATTLRHSAGTLTVTDGPFVELVEQLAGLLPRRPARPRLGHRGGLCRAAAQLHRRDPPGGRHRGVRAAP